MTKEEREKEIWRVEGLMPKQPTNPAAVIRLMEDRGRLHGHCIVYKCDWYRDPITEENRQAVRCRCSACGETWFATKLNACCNCHIGETTIGYFDDNYKTEVWSDKTAICPCCGEQTRALHVGRFGASYTHVISYTHLYTFENVGGHLAVLDWFAERMVDKDANIKTVIHPCEGAVLIAGKCVRFNGHTTVYPSGDSWHDWECRAKFYDNTVGREIELLVPFADELIAQTDADKTGIEDYCRGVRHGDSFAPASYLYLWSRFPVVENLVRTGNTRFVCGLIEASQHFVAQYYSGYEYFSPNHTKKYADWKKKKPHEILHLEKEEYRMLTGEQFEVINYYLSIKDDYGVRLSPELLEKAKRIGVMKCREITKDKEHYGRTVSPVRIINYCDKQLPDGEKRHKFQPSDLLDYWRFLHEINGKLDDALLFPSDFWKLHDRFSELVTAKKNAGQDEGIRAQAAKMSCYTYQDEGTGLMIRPAESTLELTNEGKDLSHCVGSYAKKVSRGETTIFFIRRIEAPEVSYYTLKYRSGKVIQNRGFKNDPRTPDVEEFEKKWLAFVRQVDAAKKKEEKERGQSDSDDQSGHAAA